MFIYSEKTQLLIRNTRQGMIWQIYTVENSLERDLLEQTARANHFQGFELVYGDNANYEDTFPGWRDSEVWKQRYSTAIETISPAGA